MVSTAGRTCDHRAMKVAAFLLGLSMGTLVVAAPPERTVSGLLEVKFRAAPSVRLRHGVPTDLGAGRALALPQTLAAMAPVWSRSFPDVGEKALDQLRVQAAGPLSARGRPAPDLNRYCRVRFPEGTDLAAAEMALRNMPDVTAVYRVPTLHLPVAADYLDPANGAGVWQRYVDAAPDGVDARYAWSNGVAGAGVNVCDIEYDWNENHVDLPAIGNLLAHHQDGGYGDDHGTAVFGQLAGQDDGAGVRGIASGADFFFAGANVNGDFNAGNAVVAAANALDTGDVVLLELQISGPANDNWVPLEWYEPYYDAIATAVGKGIVVVEAAGNGYQNLDDPIYATGNGGHYPFLPANDSGALLVGAGAPPSFPAPRARLDFSNYGQTVDLQGWGYTVVSAGYGGLYAAEGRNAWYTATFSGTSSAAPMVAGAAAVLQQAYRARFGQPAPPAIVRQILRATGTPQAGTENIGPFPNLRAVLAAIQNPQDADGDGVYDWQDNCPASANASQADADADGSGDVCDNCPAHFNPGQENRDGDALGDACDPDRDGDGIANAADNCPDAANAGQADEDDDGVGDACDPCNYAMPDYRPAVTRGAPGIATYAGSPNKIGERFDFNLAGGPAGTRVQCGFGSFGQIYCNYDATNLYLGGRGVDMAGDNNGMVVFVGVNTLADNQQNLWNQSGKPYGLDYLHNVSFTRPMDFAIVLGDEYGDGTFPDFNLGNGYDFGQGIFYLSATSFVQVANSLLSQYDGTGTNAVASANDDGNRLTDRWEAAIPWASLGAAGSHSVTSLWLAGVFASDGENRPDRYLSGNVLAASVQSSSGLNTFNNYGFGFVTLTPLEVDLATVDSDGDGLSDVHERVAGTAPDDPASYFRVAGMSAAGQVAVASAPGRAYQLQASANLPQPDWQPVAGATNIPGSGGLLILSNLPAVDSRRYYRVAVTAP